MVIATVKRTEQDPGGCRAMERTTRSRTGIVITRVRRIKQVPAGRRTQNRITRSFYFIPQVNQLSKLSHFFLNIFSHVKISLIIIVTRLRKTLLKASGLMS